MKKILFALFVWLQLPLLAQVTIQKVASMPEPVSNNAVSFGTQNGKKYVYSFAGIDTTKQYAGIHKKCFRYDIDADSWTTIDELPNGNGRIAAAASTVKNKIYIIGGYEVFSNGNEKSLDYVHIFNPETNQFEADGSPIPTPIDDHVQAVWRDSLIYVITGWSNNGNVTKVQIYNPTEDKWMRGSPVVNSKYIVFGGSGTIIGDTIYYFGGASDFSGFAASVYFRKGIINPDDPTKIKWAAQKISKKLYRSGASNYGKLPFWLGGSRKTYNYDGLAYDGSGAVKPLSVATFYDIKRDSIFELELNEKVMDLRGIVKISSNEFLVCGGMEDGAKVTDKAYIVNFSFPTKNKDIKKATIHISPNPVSKTISWEGKRSGEIQLYDLKGILVYKKRIFDANTVDIENLPSNVYFIQLMNEKGQLVFREKIIVSK